MIWVRRGFAILLIIIFIALFLASLVVTQVDDTLSDSDFYNKQMRKADIYNFIYDEALPAGLDEIEEENEPEDIPVHLIKVKEETIYAARKSLPPEWLQSEFEAANEALLPYFLGKTDEFNHTFILKERFLETMRVLKEDFLQGETFQSIYDDGMSFLAEKISENLDQLPYELLLTKEEIEDAMTTVIPANWIINQVGPAIDSATPYFTGDSNRFTITIDIADRVDIATTEALDLFSTEETYQYMMDELLLPMIEENLGQEVDLPFGVGFVKNEIADAIEQTLPPEWIEDRIEDVVYSMGAYIKGETATFTININLMGRKAAAMEILAQAVKDELGPYYQQMETQLGISVEEAVERYIGDLIPDQWTYTEADLRRSMGEDNQDILDKARGWFQSGWTYTEIDLKGDLDPDEEDTLEDIRDWIANGYTLTEQDLRDELDEDELDSLDDARDWIDTARSWLWVLGILPFLIIIGIGFLGGRNWKGRVYWAFTTLFIVSLIFFIGFSAAYSHSGKPEIKDAFDLENETGTELVMLEKGQEVAVNVLDNFVSGMKTDVLWIMIFSGLILAGTVAWQLTRERGE